MKMSLSDFRQKSEQFAKYQNIDQIYQSLLKWFSKNNVSINEIVESEINLSLALTKPEKKFKKSETIKICLKYNNENQVNENYDNDHIYFNNNPKDLKCSKNLSESAWGRCLDNTFAVFNTILENKAYLISIRSDNSSTLEIYDLISQKMVGQKQNAHDDEIVMVRHYANKKSRIDFILSCSPNNNIKIWVFKNNDITCIINMKNFYP